MYWQGAGLEPRFWPARTRGFHFGQEENASMAERESAAVRNADKHFRKEAQARDGAAARKEYADEQDAIRLKTARLRAQRLARDAAAASAAVTPAGPAERTKLVKG
jgi:hypothetical protein